MSNRSSDDPDVQPSPPPAASPGEILRRAREQRGLTQGAVADALHLRERVVAQLEADDYTDLPPLTFVKGYLRAYAKLVEVPEEEVSAAFRSLTPAPGGGEEPTGRTGSASRPGPAGGMRWVAGLSALALLVAAVLWWQAERAAEPMPGQEPPVGAEEQGVPADVPDEPPQPALDDAPTPEAVPEPAPSDEVEDDTAVALEAPEPAVPGPVTEPAPETADQPVVPDLGPVSPEPPVAAEGRAPPEPDVTPPVAEPPALDLRVQGESWVEVRGADGDQLLVGLVRGPDSYRFEGEGPYRVVVGNVEAVTVEYAGEPVALGPYTQGRVARLRLPPES